MGSISTHFKWAALGKFVAQMISWSSSIIVIRFLTPEDYGLMALAAILIGLAALIGEFGITAALIQDKDVTERKIQETQGFVLIIYTLITCICLACTPFFARFYDTPELEPILIALSVQFLLLALTSVDLALVQKQLDFKGVALVQMTSGTIGAIMTLSCAAFFKLGVWSLIIGTLTIFGINAIGYRLRSKRKFKCRINFKGSYNYLKFGGFLSLQRFIWYFNTQASSIVMGKALNTMQLGLFSIAKELSMLLLDKVIPIVSTVFFPLYSKLEDDTKKAEIFYTCLKALYVLLLPCCWGMALTAEFIVPVILGDQWLDAVLYIEVISLWVPFTIIAYFYPPILNAAGKPHIPMTNSLIGMVLHLSAIFVGIQWSVLGVCIGLGISNVLSVCFNTYRFLNVKSAITIEGILKNLSTPIIAASIMVVGVLIAKQQISSQLNELYSLFILLGVGATSYLLSIITIDRQILKDTVTFIKG